MYIDGNKTNGTNSYYMCGNRGFKSKMYSEKKNYIYI